jgi:hypothetical protein
MSGLYQCPKCNQYYTDSDEFDKYISKCQDGVPRAGVVECKCGEIRVSGGEYDSIYDGIMMYGLNYNKTFHENLPRFKAVMLVECSENHPNCYSSTYDGSRTIHLRPESKLALQVWWIPQIPMKPFIVSVDSIEQGVKIMDVLAEYDKFQFENKVKPDYANGGGINMWDDDSDGEGNPGWVSWHDEETGEDDPEEYLKQKGNH